MFSHISKVAFERSYNTLQNDKVYRVSMRTFRVTYLGD